MRQKGGVHNAKDASSVRAEFRRQMVELVRSGRSVEGLAGEFEPSAGAIRNWVKRADLDEGRRSDGLTTEERAELRRLKREVRQLRMEREILLDPTRYRTQAEAKMAVFDFIEGFYNPRRRHSALGQISPVNFERRREAAA